MEKGEIFSCRKMANAQLFVVDKLDKVDVKYANFVWYCHGKQIPTRKMPQTFNFSSEGYKIRVCGNY